MTATGDRSLDSLIRASEDLIKDLGVGAPEAGTRTTLVNTIARHVEQEAALAFVDYAEPATDGLVEVSVTKDEMLVHASFHAPTGDGKPLTLEAVQQAIEGARVTAGMDWEGVRGCLITCNEERTDIHDIVIARGKKPVDEVPPYLVVSERLASPTNKGEPPGARVDFKELSLFKLVTKGEELAVLKPKQAGVMGETVRANAVAFSKQRVRFPRPGKNTVWDKGKVIAQCDGRFLLNEDSFWVDKVLDILGDIDLKVGNIDFPGDVVIRGEIRDGFVVKAGKSILCKGCIGAARVECGGDLVTEQGIVGKEKAVIRTGGAVEAKFLEGCTLDAGGPVRIRTSIMNSTVHTKDKVEMGDRGVIIGGVVKAQNGVVAIQIGTERGPRTEIHCGIDFKVEQKLVWIRDRNIALAFKLREIESKMKSSTKEREVLAPLRERVKAAIHQLNESARALVVDLDRNDAARVFVRGDVFPGAYVEICHVSYFITRPRRFLVFGLDKKKGKVVEMPWEKSVPNRSRANRPEKRIP